MSLNRILKDMYFHELDQREKIFARLQLNFAAYATLLAICSYMLRMVDYASPPWAITLFYTGLLASVVLMIISMERALKALTGYKYALFPSAQESVKYKADLDAHFMSQGQYDDGRNPVGCIAKSEQMLNAYVLDSIASCVDINTRINEIRRRLNKISLAFLLYASAPLLLSACIFIFWDLDASSPRKNLLVEDSGLRDVIGRVSLRDTIVQDKE